MAEIEFCVHINKISNFYHFLQNLSEWHFSYRKFANKDWLEKLGELNQKEAAALEKFKKIHKKYTFGENFLGKYFFPKDNREDSFNFNEFPNKDDWNEINSIFSVFSNKFDLIWKIYSKKLEKTKKDLDRGFLNQEKIEKDLINFFGLPTQKKIDLFLLVSGKGNTVSGGANIDGITVEIGQDANIRNIQATIWHETIHFAFRKNLSNKISRYLKSNKLSDKVIALGYNGNQRNILEEGTVALLFPGFLKERYFGKNDYDLIKIEVSEPNVYIAQRYMILNFSKKVENYFKTKKKFDFGFLKMVEKGYNDYLEFIKL